MAKCAYCGKEYPDGQPVCPYDNTPLASAAPPANSPLPQPEWHPTLIDLSEVDGAFAFEEGFSRPDWKVISRAIQSKGFEAFELGRVWSEAARQWVMQLRADLGADYHVAESPQFILLCALGEPATKEVLSFAERTLNQILEHLKDAAWRTGHGKRVILLFEEDDDYYQYVAHFYREGIHPSSGGSLIRGGGYVHIAAPYDPFGVRPMLAHELSHNCVAHLPLPAWLNEGLAMMFETAVSSKNWHVLDRELKRQHLEFWNEENIQTFWAGVSFGIPGDSNKLSYSLAQSVLALLMENRPDIIGFIKHAHWSDAGQTAAIECLERDLGDVMSTFLGEGNWRPRRKAMALLWEAKKAARETDS